MYSELQNKYEPRLYHICNQLSSFWPSYYVWQNMTDFQKNFTKVLFRMSLPSTLYLSYILWLCTTMSLKIWIKRSSFFCWPVHDQFIGLYKYTLYTVCLHWHTILNLLIKQSEKSHTVIQRQRKKITICQKLVNNII